MWGGTWYCVLPRRAVRIPCIPWTYSENLGCRTTVLTSQHWAELPGEQRRHSRALASVRGCHGQRDSDHKTSKTHWIYKRNWELMELGVTWSDCSHGGWSEFKRTSPRVTNPSHLTKAMRLPVLQGHLVRKLGDSFDVDMSFSRCVTLPTLLLVDMYPKQNLQIQRNFCGFTLCWYSDCFDIHSLCSHSSLVHRTSSHRHLFIRSPFRVFEFAVGLLRCAIHIFTWHCGYTAFRMTIHECDSKSFECHQ